jgi:hypothetical protein
MCVHLKCENTRRPRLHVFTSMYLCKKQKISKVFICYKKYFFCVWTVVHLFFILTIEGTMHIKSIIHNFFLKTFPLVRFETWSCVLEVTATAPVQIYVCIPMCTFYLHGYAPRIFFCKKNLKWVGLLCKKYCGRMQTG